MLRRGWRVVAVDAEPEALRQLQARPLPDGHDLTPIQARFEDVPLPIGLSLVNSSFAMPLCEPEAFHRLWERIREACRPADASAANGTARAIPGSAVRA